MFADPVREPAVRWRGPLAGLVADRPGARHRDPVVRRRHAVDLGCRAHGGVPRADPAGGARRRDLVRRRLDRLGDLAAARSRRPVADPACHRGSRAHRGVLRAVRRPRRQARGLAARADARDVRPGAGGGPGRARPRCPAATHAAPARQPAGRRDGWHRHAPPSPSPAPAICRCRRRRRTSSRGSRRDRGSASRAAAPATPGCCCRTPTAASAATASSRPARRGSSR
jgi:hypothetical protein